MSEYAGEKLAQSNECNECNGLGYVYTAVDQTVCHKCDGTGYIELDEGMPIPMTRGRLMELLKDVPDDVHINVLNSEGKYSANIEFWYEDLDTRQFVQLKGLKPFYEMS